jgi:hypothetical protein
MGDIPTSSFRTGVAYGPVYFADFDSNLGANTDRIETLNITPRSRRVQAFRRKSTPAVSAAELDCPSFLLQSTPGQRKDTPNQMTKETCSPAGRKDPTCFTTTRLHNLDHKQTNKRNSTRGRSSEQKKVSPHVKRRSSPAAQQGQRHKRERSPTKLCLSVPHGLVERPQVTKCHELDISFEKYNESQEQKPKTPRKTIQKNPPKTTSLASLYRINRRHSMDSSGVTQLSSAEQNPRNAPRRNSVEVAAMNTLLELVEIVAQSNGLPATNHLHSRRKDQTINASSRTLPGDMPNFPVTLKKFDRVKTSESPPLSEAQTSLAEAREKRNRHRISKSSAAAAAVLDSLSTPQRRMSSTNAAQPIRRLERNTLRGQRRQSLQHYGLKSSEPSDTFRALNDVKTVASKKSPKMCREKEKRSSVRASNLFTSKIAKSNLNAFPVVSPDRQRPGRQNPSVKMQESSSYGVSDSAGISAKISPAMECKPAKISSMIVEGHSFKQSGSELKRARNVKPKRRGSLSSGVDSDTKSVVPSLSRMRSRQSSSTKVTPQSDVRRRMVDFGW